jgi:hypothetical protein
LRYAVAGIFKANGRSQAPNEVTERQLKELHIRVVPPIVEKKS